MSYTDSVEKDQEMTHVLKDYKFETEAEAEAFAKSQREYIDPSEDKYVMGPVYMDDEVIFKNCSWNTSKEKWWQVTIEYFR
jgi:hypothetical protein